MIEITGSNMNLAIFAEPDAVQLHKPVILCIYAYSCGAEVKKHLCVADGRQSLQDTVAQAIRLVAPIVVAEAVEESRYVSHN